MTMQHVQLNDEQVKLMQEFSDKYEALANDLKTKIPKSRGLSLAFTALEESAMWLNKAIANNDEGVN